VSDLEALREKMLAAARSTVLAVAARDGETTANGLQAMAACIEDLVGEEGNEIARAFKRSMSEDPAAWEWLSGAVLRMSRGGDLGTK
jgi:hypothetical protein